jgi:WD40 repeat protein
MLLTVIGVSIRAWVNSRLEIVQEVEAELERITELELAHIASDDAELFRARQDPNVPRWAQRQVDRYISDPHSFAPAPGLIPATQSGEVLTATVDGRAGQVVLVRWFQTERQHPTDNPPALPFQVTWFYRLDQNGIWYHTAPPDDYWKAYHAWHGTWIDIKASQVGSELLGRVATDLAILTFEGCHWLDCPEDERYQLSFEGRLSPRRQDNRWTLPALYLTGLPQNDQAEAAWLDAIKLWLIETLVQAQADSAVISDRFLYHQLVAHLESRLNLAPRPEPDIDTLTQALVERRGHELSTLWSANRDFADETEAQVLEAEVAALVALLEDQVGPQRLFELVPALDDYYGFDAVLKDVYLIAPESFERTWRVYLSTLTGIGLAPPRLSQTPPKPEVASRPPALSDLKGDQIAFICDGQVWAGNADGSRLAPLTPEGEHFDALAWSPDGHWLFTAWQPSSSHDQGAPYLLASDGSGGQALSEVNPLGVWPLDWSPDGGEVIYYLWRSAVGTEAWAIDVKNGKSRPLPGRPLWSPDGQHVVYSPVAPSRQGVWLADGNWQAPRRIAAETTLWDGDIWSPDSSRVALVLTADRSGENAIGIYELDTQQMETLIEPSDLTSAFASAEGRYLTDGADPSDLAEQPFKSLLPLSWSADGQHLLVWGQAETRDRTVASPTTLVVVPLDGGPVRMLAYGRGGFMTNAAWSPADPQRFSFTWPSPDQPYDPPNAYLFDLDAGLLYTATETWSGTWAPDGTRIALETRDQIAIVDAAGRNHRAMEVEGTCFNPVWNPTVDLAPKLPVATVPPGWDPANLRIVLEPEYSSIVVLGEITNYTGSDQQVLAVFPFLYDADGQPILNAQYEPIETDYQRLLQSVSLADGYGLPFGFDIQLPDDVTAGELVQMVIDIRAEPSNPTRDDLLVSRDDFNLSGWPRYFNVIGLFKNPGPPLDSYVTLVATAYDSENQVIGWGWFSETGGSYFDTGDHYFNIKVTTPAGLVEQGPKIESYKLQLFGE